MSQQLKWKPKDPDANIGVPGKGFIKSSDFSQEDLDNLITRAKNRKVDVHSFLLKAGLVPAQPQFELSLEEPRSFEKEEESSEEEINAHEEPKPLKTVKAPKAPRTGSKPELENKE